MLHALEQVILAEVWFEDGSVVHKGLDTVSREMDYSEAGAGGGGPPVWGSLSSQGIHTLLLLHFGAGEISNWAVVCPS